VTYLTFPEDLPAPSYGSSETVKFKVVRAAFGDGYEQTAAKGLHSDQKEWSLSWAALRADDKAALRRFVESTAGFRAFWWTPPLHVAPSLWRMREDSYSESPVSPDAFDVSFSVYRVIR